MWFHQEGVILFIRLIKCDQYYKFCQAEFPSSDERRQYDEFYQSS